MLLEKPTTAFFCVGSLARQAISDAIRDYENNTCIRFKQKGENDEDYVKFVYGSG